MRRKDRGNIGNARVMGFQQDTYMTDTDFYNAVSLYCEMALDDLLMKAAEANNILKNADIGYVICILLVQEVSFPSSAPLQYTFIP